MRNFNYQHDDHYGDSDTLHTYAEAVLDHVRTGLILRTLHGRQYDHANNRSYVRSEVRRAIAATDGISGDVELANDVCLRFTLSHIDGSHCVTFRLPWSQIRSDLRTAGYALDI